MFGCRGLKKYEIIKYLITKSKHSKIGAGMGSGFTTPATDAAVTL